MDATTQTRLVSKIVEELKIKGVFDDLRRQCLADVDTKPAFRNLKQRVEGHVSGILINERWSPVLNKNQLRNKIRNSVLHSGLLSSGIDRILHQVIDEKIVTLFLPKVSDFIAENVERLKKEFIVPPPQPQEVVPTENDKAETEEEVATDVDLPLVPADGGTVDAVPMEIDAEARSPQTETLVVEENFVETTEATEVVQTDDSPQAGGTPVIPDDAANSLRNLIQSLLTSKSAITEDEAKTEKVDEDGETSKEPDSPVIDPSQIEAFTDESDVEEYKPQLEGTAEEEEAYYEYVAATETQQNEDVPYSPTAQCLDSSPSNVYNPQDGDKDHEVVSPSNDVLSPVKDTSSVVDNDFDEEALTPKTVDVMRRLSEENNSDARNAPDQIISEHHIDKNDKFTKSSEKLQTKHRRKSQRRNSNSSSSATSSSYTTSSSSSNSSDDDESVHQEDDMKHPPNEGDSSVEEVIEETEMEDYSPSMEMNVPSSATIEVKDEGMKDKEETPPAKSKKLKKRKMKSRSHSRSSGEITTSSSNDSSEDEHVPAKRPSAVPLQDIDERRSRVQPPPPPYWKNTDSSSDCHSSPGRFFERRSPPPFDRFGERLPHPRFRDEFPPRHHLPIRHPRPFEHPRDFPRPQMDFGSPPHSPPISRFSPPHLMGDRFPGPRPRHRFSPPHHRMSPPGPNQMHPRHRMR